MEFVLGVAELLHSKVPEFSYLPLGTAIAVYRNVLRRFPETAELADATWSEDILQALEQQHKQ